MFAIYSLGEGRVVELRLNPLGSVPDPDAGGAHGHHVGAMHGISKYEWLRNNVLRDVDAIVAGGACMTSIVYFTSEGVKLLFARPGTSIGEVVEAIARNRDSLPLIGLYEGGHIVDSS